MNEQQITLRIDGMTCLDCARTLERELAKVEGVRARGPCAGGRDRD